MDEKIKEACGWAKWMREWELRQRAAQDKPVSAATDTDVQKHEGAKEKRKKE